MPQKDYYNILEISKSSTYEEIAEAYRKLSLKYHPKNSDSKTITDNSYKFHLLAEAYEVLSDPSKKKIYDIYGYEGLKNGILTQTGEIKGGYIYGGNAHEIFEKFMGVSNPFGLITDVKKNDEDWNSVYYSAYGGKIIPRKTKVAPIRIDLECTLEELFLGTIKTLKYNRDKLNYDMRTTSLQKEKIEVEIYPGYKQNTIIIFPKMGNECAGEESSDLLVKIKEKEHKYFKRINGKDLIYYKTLKLADALKSEPVKLKTLDGRILYIGIDEIISPQTVKIIKGEGMPIFEIKDDDDINENIKKGDLYIKFKIIFPDYINPIKKARITQLLEE